MDTHGTRRLAAWLVTVALLLAAGCAAARQEAAFEGGWDTVSERELLAVAKSADTAWASTVAPEDAVKERVRVLTALRGRGDEGERAADLLTAGFPATHASIPVLVRTATYDSVRAVIVVEVGPGAAGGQKRRVWVFDYATGAVLKAATVR